MEIFRIALDAHSRSLSASGNAARWNQKGEFVLYASASRALASLELLVHNLNLVPPVCYRVMVISIADDDRLYKQIKIADLPPDWRGMMAVPELRAIGSSWYMNLQSPVLKVPSAVIVQESNYLVNTRHPDFIKSVQLVRTEEFFWDARLSWKDGNRT
jgi:RES domain-containing protein